MELLLRGGRPWRRDAAADVLVRSHLVRSHTDMDPAFGLAGVEAVNAATGRLAGRVTVQQVAFPQYGILTDPRHRRNVGRNLDVVFGLAERHGAGVDIHLHDGGTLGVWQLELIASRTVRAGLSGRVAVSHAYGLGRADAFTQARLTDLLAGAGVAIVTAAVYDFPVGPLKTLRAAGVTVACGHDGIRDLWGPYGSGDMLERAMHLAYRSTFRRDAAIELALDAATHGEAALLGLPAYGLRPGAPADVVAVDARTAAEAVVTRPPRRLVLNRGRPVAVSPAPS